MKQDAWFWHDPSTTNTSIKRTILKEMLAHRLLPAPDRKSA